MAAVNGVTQQQQNKRKRSRSRSRSAGPDGMTSGRSWTAMPGDSSSSDDDDDEEGDDSSTNDSKDEEEKNDSKVAAAAAATTETAPIKQSNSGGSTTASLSSSSSGPFRARQSFLPQQQHQVNQDHDETEAETQTQELDDHGIRYDTSTGAQPLPIITATNAAASTLFSSPEPTARWAASSSSSATPVFRPSSITSMLTSPISSSPASSSSSSSSIPIQLGANLSINNNQLAPSKRISALAMARAVAMPTALFSVYRQNEVKSDISIEYPTPHIVHNAATGALQINKNIPTELEVEIKAQCNSKDYKTEWKALVVAHELLFDDPTTNFGSINVRSLTGSSIPDNPLYRPYAFYDASPYWNRNEHTPLATDPTITTKLRLETFFYAYLFNAVQQILVRYVTTSKFCTSPAAKEAVSAILTAISISTPTGASKHSKKGSSNAIKTPATVPSCVFSIEGTTAKKASKYEAIINNEHPLRKSSTHYFSGYPVYASPQNRDAIDSLHIVVSIQAYAQNLWDTIVRSRRPDGRPIEDQWKEQSLVLQKLFCDALAVAVARWGRGYLKKK